MDKVDIKLDNDDVKWFIEYIMKDKNETLKSGSISGCARLVQLLSVPPEVTNDSLLNTQTTNRK